MDLTSHTGTVGLLPDRAVPAVRIPSCHCPHLCATGCVLINIHDVIIHRKDRGLVHVAHCYFKGGRVFKRSQVGEPRVRVSVRAFNLESVALLPLIVQRLRGRVKG